MKIDKQVSNDERYIVWAVDALSDEFEIQKRTAQMLRALSTRKETKIEPVYVHSARLARLPAEVFLPPHADVKSSIEKNLSNWLATLDVPNLLPLKVLQQDDISLRSQVITLVSYAKEKGANFIATSTTAKKGTDRLFLGSFAETLFLQSELSTLVINPTSRISEKVAGILFPTDFEDGASDAFLQTLALARDLGAKLTVFHKADLIPVGLYRYVSMPSYTRYLDDEVAKLEVQAMDWARRAEKMGVALQILIEKERGDVASAIIHTAEGASIDLIAMAPQKGPLGAAILGSATRNVVRNAPCPVWIIR